MTTKAKFRRRKFLKSIYAIQEAFGQEVGTPQRTVSCGLVPTVEEEGRLSQWFDQVTAAKRELYSDIYADFKRDPRKFIGPKDGFDYRIFFKGRKVLMNLNKNRPLITSQPIMEGLRNEIEGTIRSFRTNFERLFNESLRRAGVLEKSVQQNNETLKKKADDSKPENSVRLLSLLQSLGSQRINHVTLSIETIQGTRDLIDSINYEIGDYNRELNEIISDYEISREEVQFLTKLGRLPVFPRSDGNIKRSRGKLLDELESLARLPVNKEKMQDFFKKRIEKLTKISNKKAKNKTKRFEDRLINWLVKERGGNFGERDVSDFVRSLESKLTFLDQHLRKPKKDSDTRARNEYLRLLVLRARLSNIESTDVHILLSRLRGTLLSGRKEREVINIPGFSWADKPRKNATLAFKDNKLYVCISNSVSNFKIDPDGDLRFVKSVGGSRQKRAYKPKRIEYIQGIFDTREQENNTPLFLMLHFGKSYVRRNLFHRSWGVFSKNPQIFLNAGKLKRERAAGGNTWKYFFDLSLSGDKIYSLKEFSNEIHKNAEAVIGIDRGEVKPIAYAVLSKRNGDLLSKGFLASEYISKLEYYDKIKRTYQENSQTFPRYLRSKVSQLKKTMMATAASEILEMIGKYKAIVVMEDLGSNFVGIEKRLIPKRIYKKVEQVISGAVEQAGILKIVQPKGAKGGSSPYWGALLQVNPGGTSQTCLECGITWNSNLKDTITGFSEDSSFKNIDFRNNTISLSGLEKWLKDKKSKPDNKTYERGISINGVVLKLNEKFEVFNRQEKRYEAKTLSDIKTLLSSNATKKEKNRALSWLKLSMGPRIKQELFICPKCGFQDNADLVGAVNVARQGIKSLERLHKRD